MDSSEIHYLEFDPVAIFDSMMLAYIRAGGDVVYGGDERELFMRGLLAFMVQCFSSVDNALRMDTLRYAEGEYLDLYGEKRGCERIEAASARAAAAFTLRGGFPAVTIPKGTSLTSDGSRFYTTDEDIAYGGIARVATVGITCTETGSLGNGLLAQTQMQMASAVSCVMNIVCTQAATGGSDREDDETYRARIREWALRSVTTGPAGMYEQVARSVSNEIVDAKAVKTDDGEVLVSLIIDEDASAETIIADVTAALNDKSARPLTDLVTVQKATDCVYQLDVRYVPDYGSGTNVGEAVAAAAAEYKAWQENEIGRAFNPDKLVALLYQAGATHVTFAATSHFMEGEVEYTEIDDDERCKGEITLTVVSA